MNICVSMAQNIHHKSALFVPKTPVFLQICAQDSSQMHAYYSKETHISCRCLHKSVPMHTNILHKIHENCAKNLKSVPKNIKNIQENIEETHEFTLKVG
jgi:hypothetical protein